MSNGGVESPDDLLATITVDLLKARAAERVYIDWLSAHPNASFAEFSDAYFDWVEAGEAFERIYKTIEERHPSFIEKMLDAMALSDSADVV
jgi:hypothetical protein